MRCSRIRSAASQFTKKRNFRAPAGCRTNHDDCNRYEVGYALGNRVCVPREVSSELGQGATFEINLPLKFPVKGIDSKGCNQIS